MWSEGCVIDLSRTEYRIDATTDTHRVLRNTDQLLTVSSGIAAAGDGVSMLVN